MKRKQSRRPAKKSNQVQSKKSEFVKPENYKYIPIEDIVVEGWNYKKKDDKLQTKLENNIKKNGQIENLLVRNLGNGKYGLVNGHHRLDALISLGIDQAFIYDLGEISLELAKRIGIETNETKFESDNIALAEILSDLSTEFGKLELETTLPFSETDLENFDNLLSFNWEDDSKPDTDDDEEEIDGDGHKSSTVVSAGGDKFRTIKLELAPDLADFFEEQIGRLKSVGGSSEKPIELMLNYVSKAKVEEIMKASETASKRRAKKKR
jgi:hypothetical protein